MAVGLGSLVVGAAAALLVYDTRIAGVSNARVVHGVVLGAVLLGVVPPVVYYLAARGLKSFDRPLPRPMTLAGVWLMSVIPLSFYTVGFVLKVITLTGCQAGQYDCLF